MPSFLRVSAGHHTLNLPASIQDITVRLHSTLNRNSKNINPTPSILAGLKFQIKLLTTHNWRESLVVGQKTQSGTKEMFAMRSQPSPVYHLTILEKNAIFRKRISSNCVHPAFRFPQFLVRSPRCWRCWSDHPGRTRLHQKSRMNPAEFKIFPIWRVLRSWNLLESMIKSWVPSICHPSIPCRQRRINGIRWSRVGTFLEYHII